MNLDSQQKTRLAIALGAVVALVLGFSVLNKSDSDSTASANTAMGGPGMQQGQAPPGAQGNPGANGATGGGMGPGRGGPPNGGQGGPPQMTELTGTTKTKAVAAAKTKASGTVEHVFEEPNGSGYVVIFEKSDGTHVGVQVSKDFKVTGTQTMQMGPGGKGQGQGAPPAGAQQQGTNTQ